MPRASSTLPTPGPRLSVHSSGLVRPGDRPADVIAFENSMVDFFVDAADLLGFVPEYSPHLD